MTSQAEAKHAAQWHMVAAMLRLAEENAWDTITLRMIAEAVPCSLADLAQNFPSKEAMLGAFFKHIDAKVLRTGLSEEDIEENEQDGMGFQDRLAELWLRRLDGLAPYRRALNTIAKGLRYDIASLLALNRLHYNAMRYMVELAGGHFAGPQGALALQALVLLWARVLATWLEDDTPDIAKTMAILDSGLSRTLEIMTRVQAFSRPLCQSS